MSIALLFEADGVLRRHCVVSEPITIREAQAADIPFMRAMIWEFLLASPGFLSHMGLETIRRQEEQYWAAWTAQADPAFIAVDSTGRALGVILLKPSDLAPPAVGWRISMGLEVDARGQGIAQQLMQRAIAFAMTYRKRFGNPNHPPPITVYRLTGVQDNVIEIRLDFGP